MAIPPKGRGTPNLNIRPDIDDPDIYCKSCQFKYKCGGVYRGYLKKIRKMEITPPRNKLSLFDPNVSVNDAQDPRNTICAICKRKYSRRSGCLQHMKNWHRNGKNTPATKLPIVNSNIQPNPKDINCYCLSCQKHYSDRTAYRHHIRDIHPDVKLTKKRSIHWWWKWMLGIARINGALFVRQTI